MLLPSVLQRPLGRNPVVHIGTIGATAVEIAEIGSVRNIVIRRGKRDDVV
jgi:hypothetical protein